MTRLAFDDVDCTRSGRLLFQSMTFDLGPGDAALVTGPNGVGKSSLVRIAAGLLAPGGGAVIVRGTRALLGAPGTLDRDLPLAGALGFWAAMDGREAAVDPALDALGLTALAAVPVRLLSQGQRQRAALAAVAASGAAIWLLDEPANGLDDRSVRALETLVAGHRAGGGIALIATHLPIALPDALPIRLAAA